MDESRTLAAHVANTRFSNLPAEAVKAAQHSLVDAVGVMYAATGLVDACRVFAEMVTANAGSAESTLLFNGARVPAAAAAFANGALSHAVDFEDTHDVAVLHPNAAVVPAALAIAEMRGDATGKDLLTAIAVGADIVCRLGLGLLNNPHDRGWYHAPMLGAFGASAAAASLLRLDSEQVMNALALTLCQSVCSAQFQQDPASDVRAVRDAFAAQAGVTSALLAQRGIRGFVEPFEGKAGWYQLYADGQYDASLIVKGLGEIYEGANVSYKAWPCCRGTHPFVEAALRFVDGNEVALDEIRSITLHVNGFTKMLCEPLERKTRPQTAIDAKFSIPFAVASALVNREVGLTSFSPEKLADPAVARLMDRMNYVVDAAADFKTPLDGMVTVTTIGGREVSETVLHPRGHPSNPMSERELLAKFKSCSDFHVRPTARSQADALAELMMCMPSLEDLSSVWQALGRNAA
ncbi:MmgE/PrpD family protein [Paraburkholderia fungorum]|uniref:MmgE/PrpD family protein n=1 Tax=Paraburkholderia fungorum TaxID=134537 RepID=UPI0020934185|nr:MmgE/PrpD family protein [Paraburkholderia fungorum]USU18908.1 MmgE/PrpD family protein [Paraburkholderia fungorum]USU29096.1 MmgE/PrpD family protein [Paraburkholderia fungorum]